MSETSTPILDEPLIDERSKVESWRLHILIEAGYPLSLAARPAVSEADPHIPCEILGRGCQPATASDILLSQSRDYAAAVPKVETLAYYDRTVYSAAAFNRG